MPDDVFVIGMGGTFDKVYDPVRETMDFDGKSVIPEILEEAFLSGCTCHLLRQIDSLHMTDTERSELLELINATEQNRIVIVRGTSRMIETGLYISSRIKDRVVVLTGALRPYRYSATEAACNLGGAISAARLLDRGTYIFMHGRVMRPESSNKNPQTGLFG